MSEEKFVYTACPGWGDHDYCALKTIVKDGKIDHCERIIYSEPEELDGHICQKGCLAARMPYDPARIQYPMKRVGERGEGKWERISWDQALDEIAEKLIEIRDKYGPQSVAAWELPAGVPAASGVRSGVMRRFLNLYGVTNMQASIGLDNGPSYTEFYLMNTMYPHVVYDPQNIIGTDLIYVWGCNPIENQMRCAQNLVRAREAGAKIVDIGLIFDGTAGFADEFVGVKPGSDGHLAMAFIDYAIKNDYCDFPYLLDKTNVAYLVRDDNGMLAQDAEGNYLVFDADAQAITPVAPVRGAYSSANIAFTGHYEYDGVGVTPAFQLLKDRAAEFSAEAVADYVGLSATKIEALAEEWFSAEKAYIISGLGLRYANANETYRMFNLLGLLTGRLGKPQSGVIESLMLMGYPVAVNDIGVACPEGPYNVKSKSVRMHDWFKDAESDDSPYHAFLAIDGNPVHQQPDRQRWLNILSKMDLVVDFDVWLTDTGELADYVLPELMSFERKDLVVAACYNHIVLQEPAIEPQVDAIDFVDLFSGLGKRLGFGEYFDKTVEDYIDMYLDVDFYPPISTIEPKVTCERLEKEKMVRINVPAVPKYDPWLLDGDAPYGTPTGRLEIYAERLAEQGVALTKPLEPRVLGKSEEYPFQFFSGRQRFFMQSSYTDDPINIELSGGEPATRINPKDARALGLEDGDIVEVYSDTGHVVTKLDIDECVPAGTVHVWFGWRKRQFIEGTYAEVATPCAGELSVGPIEDKWYADYIAAGNSDNPLIDFLVTEAGSTDMYWDSVCNIRKYEPKEA